MDKQTFKTFKKLKKFTKKNPKISPIVAKAIRKLDESFYQTIR